ncbi:hypothetical protein ASPWEDRAFT_48111 [Aspergillus wentii DTO 134E9]|uniref:Expansin-like EG45 domain-containing protein n=1 Tax=Aspergillus wentii DTO 134E9 TaxID=1073089 RepID=A0A1L9S332_ASPWE|nr:uncharacterized protein ASPWEDRAFT_48111 [Aspergillus wentii DTO 134E9]KAI9929908.1 hypothetical protein MW887_011718 [Aspergillus wentii]OJJ41560.1 hypothetical protein ASPWEDRAFT_48111 [Aspergillus wentii DTO 134E9]
MKYQRLTSLGVTALSAAASVSAVPFVQREAVSQCPSGYSMSVYYITVAAEPTPSSTSSVGLTTTLYSTSTVTLYSIVHPETPAQIITSSSAQSTVDVTSSVVSEASPVYTSSSTVETASTTTTQAPTIVPSPETGTTLTTAAPTTTSSSEPQPTSTSMTSTIVPPAEPSTTTSSTITPAAAPTTSSESQPTSSSTSTSTVATTTSSASSSSQTSSVSGEATYYEGDVSAGTCSFSGYTLPSNVFGTALSVDQWDTAASCGACVSITGPSGNSIKAMIVDQCPSCDSNHFDLFQDAFSELAEISTGVIDIDWSYVSCDIDSPLTLKNKDGTSEYWFAMQVVNANEPVTSLEVSTDGGSTWQSTTRTYYNYFEQSSGFGTDTVDVRVTGKSGKTVTVENVSCASESSVTASSNL